MLTQILAAWLKSRRATVASRPAPTLDLPFEEDRPLGCGWFDSSHELTCGLMVTEHLCPDAVAAELPLSDWIGMQLSGWRGELRGA